MYIIVFYLSIYLVDISLTHKVADFSFFKIGVITRVIWQ